MSGFAESRWRKVSISIFAVPAWHDAPIRALCLEHSAASVQAHRGKGHRDMTALMRVYRGSRFVITFGVCLIWIKLARLHLGRVNALAGIVWAQERAVKHRRGE